MRNRYIVRRCDECPPLKGNTGKLIDHTWDVVDTSDGHIVSNHDRRSSARAGAKAENLQARGIGGNNRLLGGKR